MTISILALVVALVVGYQFLEDRKRARYRNIVSLASRAMSRYARQELTADISALRDRPLASATLTLAALQVIVFVMMMLGRDSLSDPATLVGWGASLGPKTSNGEWWRLATAPFVHGGFITLMLNTIALVQIGLLLERAVGGLLLSTTYVGAAVLASVAHVWGYPLALAAGPAGAMCGLYGLALALLLIDRHAVDNARISIEEIRRILPMAAMVLFSSLARTGVGIAGAAAGAAAGLGFGLIAISRVSTETPSRRRVGVAVAVACGVAVIGALSLRGITDIRPEITRLIELEQTTATTYEAAYAAHQKRRHDAEALAQVIEGTIVPALQEADGRFKALRGVPAGDRWQVDQAIEYLRLRSRSWSLRAEGLREASTPAPSATKGPSPALAKTSGEAAARFRSSLLKLGSAEAAERSALQALDRLTRSHARRQKADL